MKKKILIYPSTTEIGKELIRSFKYSTHFETITASNEPPADFVLTNDLSKRTELRDELINLVKREQIDAIYPAHDEAVYQFKDSSLSSLVIASRRSVTEICRYKSKTYSKAPDISPYVHDTARPEFSRGRLFAKPDKGQGSRGAVEIYSDNYWQLDPDKYIIMDLLPGDEYTVDCFSQDGVLLFCKGRERIKTTNGISSSTKSCSNHREFTEFGTVIQSSLAMEGAWFFQVKRDGSGTNKLLEVSSRISGCSSYWRMEGVNLPMMSAHAHFGTKVSVCHQENLIEGMRRDPAPRYEFKYEFEHVFVDYDDTLIIAKKRGAEFINVVNHRLISLLFQWQEEGKKLHLITRNNNPDVTRFPKLFLNIFLIGSGEEKHQFIKDKKSIFIDDSFMERASIYNKHKIPVFSPAEIEDLFYA